MVPKDNVIALLLPLNAKLSGGALAESAGALS